jgi:hypothetical protein
MVVGVHAAAQPAPAPVLGQQDDLLARLGELAARRGGGDREQDAGPLVDAGAVADGNPNAAQRVLGVRATHGDDVKVPIYAFAAALGSARVLDAARTLARQSHLPRRELTLVDRHTTYAHNDPAGAFPKNVFLSRLVTFLSRLD